MEKPFVAIMDQTEKGDTYELLVGQEISKIWLSPRHLWYSWKLQCLTKIYVNGHEWIKTRKHGKIQDFSNGNIKKSRRPQQPPEYKIIWRSLPMYRNSKMFTPKKNTPTTNTRHLKLSQKESSPIISQTKELSRKMRIWP